ncbi:MFS transporter [Salimicrobium halophilum]|nr:MFS transporter [Salimicrobium halophilum]
MEENKMVSSWRHPILLLFGIGLSNIGDWIYLIALNLIVLEMTGSPLAVAVLYILLPTATVCTNFWSGTLVDRLNQRNLMVALDFIRASLIFMIPFFPTLWLIYPIVFLVNMASSIFNPASMSYITKLIPRGKRKRFNSFRSLIDSGGFLVGPAIAGFLLMAGDPFLAIYVNALTFLFSGIVTLFLPVTTNMVEKAMSSFSLQLLKKDWNVVVLFTRNYASVMLIYFLFGLMMVMAAALDSLEAAFSKEVLNLTDAEYGFLVSIAGVGIATGAIIIALFADKISTSLLLGIGPVLVAGGYIIYAFSDHFEVAAVGFIVLAFSLAFANTGFHTFYQNNIPVEILGRIGSIYGLIEAAFTITATIVIGIAAQFFSIKAAVITGSFVMLVVTLILGVASYNFEKRCEAPVQNTAVRGK